MLRDIRFLESRRNAPLLDLDYINLVRKVKKCWAECCLWLFLHTLV